MASAPEQSDSIANSSDALLLAVDAGGTKTAAWLVDLSQPQARRIVGRGRAAAGNPLSAGFNEATRAVSEAIAAARRDANHPNDRVDRIILSVAGAANDEVSKRLVEWARSLDMAKQVAVVSDVLPVLAAGTPQCVGICLIAGTGSVAFGRNADGKTQLCGGWGYLLGDEGSGYFVGRTALSRALNHLERYSVLDPFTAAVVNALDAESVTGVTKAIYTSPDPRATIASIAPIVVNMAEANEPNAEAILAEAGQRLATLVARTAHLIDLTDQQFPLALAGGLIVGSNRVRIGLQSSLQKFGVQCAITIVDEPLEGCLRLAARGVAGTIVKWH